MSNNAPFIIVHRLPANKLADALAALTAIESVELISVTREEETVTQEAIVIAAERKKVEEQNRSPVEKTRLGIVVLTALMTGEKTMSDLEQVMVDYRYNRNSYSSTMSKLKQKDWSVRKRSADGAISYELTEAGLEYVTSAEFQAVLKNEGNNA